MASRTRKWVLTDQKILILGNAAGGKTRLAKRFERLLGIPILHVDSIQFLPGMKLRDLGETRGFIREFLKKDSWVIDGYGPLDILEERMQIADRIYFIDLPIWRHYWWATLRQFKNLYSRRKELPEGCSELSVDHIAKLFRTISRIHHKMRPEMLRILSLPKYRDKVVQIKSLQALRAAFPSD